VSTDVIDKEVALLVRIGRLQARTGQTGRGMFNDLMTRLREVVGHEAVEEALDAVGPRLAGYWTLERCKASALNYTTRSGWEFGAPSAHSIACRNKWLDECCKHMDGKAHHQWTFEECRASAMNYSTRKEWDIGDKYAYAAARYNKWLDECCGHMDAPRGRKATLEACKISALKYSTRNEWQKKDQKTHRAACKNKWLDLCCSHMVSRQSWTFERCKASARNYKTRADWKRGDRLAHGAAKSHSDWFDQCCVHMGPPRGNRHKSNKATP